MRILSLDQSCKLYYQARFNHYCNRFNYSNNAGPLLFGPRRYTPPALELDQLPKIDLWLKFPPAL